MSSTGSSVSSQSSEDAMASQPATRLGSLPFGRIKSEHDTSSLPGSVYYASNHAAMMRPGGSDGRMHPKVFDRSSRRMSESSNHGQSSIPTLSNRGGHERPTWSEFLTESSTLAADLDADTMNTVAADRKRRLTGSAQDSGRRRTVSGRFHNRHLSAQSHQLDGPSSPQRSALPWRTDSMDQLPTNYIDLTTSPSPAPRVLAPPSSAGPRFSSTRQYVLPKWQPDSEVSECPICKRQFSLLFRRHHCRKCGRVVCNDCSPHRITIPRQFIVHPPDPSGQTPSRLRGTRTFVETIDLTEDTEHIEGSNFARNTAAVSNPALGGGEKVRLCNPCVPDPQPSPHLDLNVANPSLATQTPWGTASADAMPSDSFSDIAIRQFVDLYQAALPQQGTEFTRERGRGMMVSYTVLSTTIY